MTFYLLKEVDSTVIPKTEINTVKLGWGNIHQSNNLLGIKIFSLIIFEKMF